MIKKDKPKKVRGTVEELEVLARLKSTVEWAILKRVANRYASQLRRKAFNLPESHPNFKIEHVDYTGQVRGMKALIRFVETAGKRLEEREK